MFIHVHKTGGFSIESALEPHLKWNDLILGTTALGEAMNAPFLERYGLSDHSSVDEILAVCGPALFQDYFSFALVRHPVSRAVSLYNYVHSLCKFHTNRTGECLDRLQSLILDTAIDDAARLALVKNRPYLDWSVTKGFLKGRSFTKFIRSPMTRSDVAFFPQSERVCSLDGKVKVDLCIKLEELNVHIPSLSKKLGVPLQVGHENASPFRILEEQDVSLDDQEYLRREFNQDYLAFEYR